MSNRELKDLITLRAVRGANTRIMDRSSETGKFTSLGAVGRSKVISLTSDKIAQAGQVAFSSLKRR